MKDRMFRHTRRTRPRSPSPRRKFRGETRRSGSGRIEPERSRVVSSERDHQPQPDRSNNINDISLYGESLLRGGETTSSKFHWNNLLNMKRVENATSSTEQNDSVNDYRYGIVTETHGFSGSGTVVPTVDPRRSYAHTNGGFVSALKKKEVGGALPKHWEDQQHQHQHVDYGLSTLITNASSSSSFGGSLGLCRSVGIGADGHFAEHAHAHAQRSVMNDAVACSNNGGFLPPEFQRPSIVDSIVEKMDGAMGSHGNYLGKGAPWEENEHFVGPRGGIDVIQPSKHYVEPLVCRNVHLPEYAIDGYRERESCNLRSSENDAYTSIYQGDLKGLPVTTEELAVHDLDEEMMELKHGGNIDEDPIWTDFDTGLPHCQWQCVYDSFDDGIMPVQFDERSDSRYSLVPAEWSSRKLRKITEKSMKMKPKPHRVISLPSSSVSSRSKRINVHARLGPRVVPAEDSYNTAKKRTTKKLKRNLCDFSTAFPCSDPSEQLDVKVKEKSNKMSKKTEPPEDSKEFKQLVRNAFFKFVKILNENPSLRRKYVEQGRIDTLRCTLCGSKSKEFANTHSLAMHSFNSTKAKHRAEHLGFHKALCVLLGWSNRAASDGLWVQQILPADEAANLRNDLIIWPPVVLIHNSSVAHSDPDKRVIVSIEGLEDILRGMGFGGGKTKVSRGKPANYSILVVTFNATFSGLQEAERLHKFYADKKQGEDELQQIDGSSLKNSNTEDNQCMPENVESVLYGYLGNAGDLDKLDFESKKRTVVKSKKEIQAIADATLREN